MFPPDLLHLPGSGDPTLGVCVYSPLSFREPSPEKTLSDKPQLAADYWRAYIATAQWFDPMKENLVVLLLNTKYFIMGHHLVAIGLLNTVNVHAREVFRPAIGMAAHSVILLHNHPSGDPTPSECDIRVTRTLLQGGQLLDIELLDHIVMGQPSALCPTGYCSLREAGHLK